MADTCSIIECEKIAICRSWCQKHYKRWRTHGDPTTLGTRKRSICKIQGCGSEMHSRGWCASHYAQWRRWGDPEAPTPTRIVLPPRPCFISGCSTPSKSLGWCPKHYWRYRKYGDPLILVNVLKSSEDLCTIQECDNPQARKGWCQTHYSRWYKNGDPTTLKTAIHSPGKSKAFIKEWVDNYKLTHGCSDCGYNLHPAALDFDHLPGTIKIRDIKSGQQFGWVALQAEISKCEVVCANCHRIRTSERRKNPPVKVKILKGRVYYA